jgi:hypothetical protein
MDAARMRKAGGLLAAGALLAALLWAWARSDRPARAPREDVSPSAPTSDGRPPDRAGQGGQARGRAEPTGLGRARKAVETLGKALQRDGAATKVQETAASLRRLLRGDASARQMAQSLLLDPETPRDLRAALALVLGTLPGEASDGALLEALERFATDREFVRCALLALAATRAPPEDDEVFGLGDRPWGEHGPGGLGVTVRRAIEDPRVRQAIALHLQHEDSPVRRAAALALRHSVEAADVRRAFLSALAAEPRDEVALVMGEALAGWAGGTEDRAARAEVVRRLLGRAGDDGFDGYRFRMEDDLRRVALDLKERALLHEYALSARPFAVRSFALTVLAGSAERSGREAEDETRALLHGLLAGDRDGAVRDLAARLLGKLPPNAESLELLAEVSRRDPAWNVRYAAVEALAASGRHPRVVAALTAASSDTDPRVAKRARALARRR